MNNREPRFSQSDEQDPEKQAEYQAGEVSLAGRSKGGKFLENLWYHYKFQIIAALLVIVLLTVCIVQCATRAPAPDYILCYAGRADLRPASANTVQADIASSTQALLADRELAGETVEVYHYLIQTGTSDGAVMSNNRTNIENLQNELALGNTYLFLLEEDLFDSYTKTGGDRYVVPVVDYLPEGQTLEITPDGYGVYLRSTPLAALPGFSELPEDTVLCLRVGYTLGGGKSAEKAYARYEALFRAMLSTR